MSAATLPLLINILVAGMFVASFWTVARINPELGHVRWIAFSYLIGMITPVAELVLPLAPTPIPFMLMSYAGLLTGMVIMAPALALLYGQRANWMTAAVIVVAGLIVRGLIWNGPRNTLWYELAYQLPFAIAAMYSAFVVFRYGAKSGLHRTLAVLFLAIAVHFLLKPLAATTFGSGSTASDYSKSVYATISQASSGVLLIAAGLLVLIITLQMAVAKSQMDATTDPLSGLPNRRALHAAFSRIAIGREKLVAAIAIFDIDNFKRINDTLGHDKGDRVIVAVARCLEENRPANGMIARVGGEEFVLLIPWQNEASALQECDRLRLLVTRLPFQKLDQVTVSAGVTAVIAHEDLSSSLSRADRGLYRAKAAGKNQCVFKQVDQSQVATEPVLRRANR